MTAPEIALPLPAPGSIAEVLAKTSDAVARSVPVVLATVLTRRGSAPATPGQKLMLAADGTCIGTIGGGALERQTLVEMAALMAAIESGQVPDVGDGSGPRTLAFDLGAGLGMCCGGGVEVLLEPHVPAHTVLIVGAGHVATALAPSLATLGFAITVCDDRDAWADATRIPSARVVQGSFRDAGRELSRRGAVLVMTHDHALDQEAIEWALREGFAFVGGVGSRAKIARTRTRLEARGFASVDIARVRMPLGISIGARSPCEIAVAIAAEMVAWRRKVALEVIESGARARPADVVVASPRARRDVT